jgi:hypothetical protein
MLEILRDGLVVALLLTTALGAPPEKSASIQECVHSRASGRSNGLPKLPSRLCPAKCLILGADELRVLLAHQHLDEKSPTRGSDGPELSVRHIRT